MSSPPCITLDARKLNDFGIGRYIENCIQNLVRHNGNERYRLLLSPDTSPPTGDERFELRYVHAPGYGLREHIEVARAAQGTQLLHAPHYVLPLVFRGPCIVTIHDLIHLRFPEYFGKAARLYARAMIATSYRRARLVLTVSETVKQDVLDTFGGAPERIRVIPNEVSDAFYREADMEAAKSLGEQIALPEHFVLAAGNTKPHKDLPCLIRAMARIDAPLVLAGGADPGDLPERAEAAGVTLLRAPHLTVDELAELFRRATVVAHPSRYEGFGLPVAEAMAAGTPVIAARAGAVPEVGAGAIRLFEPGDAEELAAGLSELLADESGRQRAERLGRERAVAFRSGSTMQALVEAHRTALGMGNDGVDVGSM